MPRLLELIQTGRIDPSLVVTHRMPLRDAAHAYDIFRDKQDGCVEVVLAALAAADYAEDFANLAVMIQQQGNLVPEMYRDCVDFTVAVEF